MELPPPSPPATLQRADCPIAAAMLVFFDLETSGLRPDRGARIREMAVVGRRSVQFHRFLPEGASAAVRRKALRACLDHVQSGVVVGHNVRFDLAFLAAEAARLGEPGPVLRFIDTLALARRLWPDASTHRLESLLDRFGIAPRRPLHTALGDALATRALFNALVERTGLTLLGEAGMMPLDWAQP